MAFEFDATTAKPESGFDPTTATAYEPPKPVGGFGASAKQAMGALVKGAGQAAEDFLPAAVGKDNAIKKYGQSVIDANPTATHGFADIADSPWMAAKEATGNAAGSMGSMLGIRALGMGITAASPLTGPFAPATALAGQAVANVGPFVAAALPSFGGIREKQIAKDPNSTASMQDKALAAAGAGTVGLIEGKFGPQAWAMKAMTKEGRAQLAKGLAETTLAKGVGYGALKGAAVEGAEELVQNPIEQLASYEDPRTPQNIKETLFGGAMGAIGGGVLGGATGAANQMLDRTAPPATNPAITPADQAPPTTAPGGAVPPAGPTQSITGTDPAALMGSTLGGLGGNANSSFLDGARSAEVQQIVAASGGKPGALAQVAIASIQSGVSGEIQLQQANEADQAAYEQATAEQEQQAAELDTANQSLTKIAEKQAYAAMSDEDKRAILFSNKSVADGGKQYVGTQDGDILNGMGKPYPNRFAAARRAHMEGKDWTIAPVFDGFVARRKDANGPSPEIQPGDSGSTGGRSTDTTAGVGTGATDGNGLGAQPGRLPDAVLDQPAELPKRVDASPVATTRAQPTTLGTQTTATAGPGFTAKDVTRVPNPAPRADTAPAAKAVEAPQDVASDAATSEGLPGAGSADLETNRLALQLGNGESAPSKGSGDTRSRDAKLLGNFVETDSFRKKGLNGINIEGKRVVLSSMIGLLNDFEVFKRVIKFVPIDVMNVLSGRKGSTNSALNHKAVLKNIASINTDTPVPLLIDAASSLARIVALRAAEPAFMPGKTGGVSDDLNTTVPAVSGNLSAEVRGSAGDATKLVTTSGSSDAGSGPIKGDAARTTIDNRHVVTPTSDDVLGTVGGETPSVPPTVSKNSGMVNVQKVSINPIVKTKEQPNAQAAKAIESTPKPEARPSTSIPEPATDAGVGGTSEAGAVAEPVAPKSLLEAIERKRPEKAHTKPTSNPLDVPTDAQTQSASDIANEMAELRKTAPRPINKMFGSNPTDEQIAQHKALTNAHNNAMSKLSKRHKVALERDNKAFRDNQQKQAVATPTPENKPDPIAQSVQAPTATKQKPVLTNADITPEQIKSVGDITLTSKVGGSEIKETFNASERIEAINKRAEALKAVLEKCK